MTETRKILAKPWDVMTCERGHPKFLVLKTIDDSAINDLRKYVMALDCTTPIRDGGEWKCYKCEGLIASRDSIMPKSRYLLLPVKFYIKGKIRNQDNYLEEVEETTD